MFLQVWMWSKAKFVNRKFLMEEVYQQFKAEQCEDKVCFWNNTDMFIRICKCFLRLFI